MTKITQRPDEMTDEFIISHSDSQVRHEFSLFLKELNKREYNVRVGKMSFHDYARNREPASWEGYGFQVKGNPVPYFHPNRSFHDEIIWLNDFLFYNKEAKFEDRLINAAIVKFYGPARTLSLITGHENLPYLEKTESNFVVYDRALDPEYMHTICSNLEKAVMFKEKIWGTTELRTSLQTAARNYSREHNSVIDTLGIKGQSPMTVPDPRPMRPSDIINWVVGMSKEWSEFYKTKPDMESSFKFLTSTRGIGNYYGYHFSTNLARMPGIGTSTLIEKEHLDRYKSLLESDSGLTHGNICENSDFVVPGPGSSSTLRRLFPGLPMTEKHMMRYFVAIRNNQESFFGMDSDDILHLEKSSELGKFTTFGIEILCCQFDVFCRLKDDLKLATKRSQAPISTLASSNSSLKLDMFDI